MAIRKLTTITDTTQRIANINRIRGDRSINQRTGADYATFPKVCAIENHAVCANPDIALYFGPAFAGQKALLPDR